MIEWMQFFSLNNIFDKQRNCKKNELDKIISVVNKKKLLFFTSGFEDTDCDDLEDLIDIFSYFQYTIIIKD